jgi:hypothetical protein
MLIRSMCMRIPRDSSGASESSDGPEWNDSCPDAGDTFIQFDTQRTIRAMRSSARVLLIALIILSLLVPGAAAITSTATLTVTGTVVTPTPTPVQPSGGGGGTPTGGGGQTGHSSNDIISLAPAPPVLGPVAHPVAPPAAAPVNPPAASLPGPQAVAPVAVGPAPAVPPSPLISIYAVLTMYGSILWILILFAVAAAYAYSKRDALSRYQTWITLYLISMTGFLWAAFVYSEGGPLAESVFLMTSVAGLNLIVHVFRYDRIEIPLPAVGGLAGPR